MVTGNPLEFVDSIKTNTSFTKYPLPKGKHLQMHLK